MKIRYSTTLTLFIFGTYVLITGENIVPRSGDTELGNFKYLGAFLLYGLSAIVFFKTKDETE